MNVTGVPGEMQQMSIGDVSRYLNTNVSTLRYWEKEFGQFLKLPRTSGRQRRYNPDNMKILNEIKYMLEVEKYTIDGARRRMALNRSEGKNFKQILNDALDAVEKGVPKNEVVENIVQRHQLGI